MTGSIFQYPCRDGTTGLELEVVRHHYSRVTPSYGCNLVNAVLQALDEAASCATVELRAATKIQATFRMYQQAKDFRDVRRKACTIQRMYRGYSTRKRLMQERLTTEKLAYLHTVFDMFATKIQATYRGYRSRKTTSNYYAQKAYINEVTARSLGVLQDAHRTRVEQDKLRTAEAQRVHALDYARRTAQMHHTISTFAIPSVYLRPPASSARLAQTLQTVAGSGEGAVSAEVLAKAVEDYEVEQVAVFTAGEKLEEDIRANSRVARPTRDDASAKFAPRAAASPPRSTARATAPQPASTSSPSPSPPTGPRSPAVGTTARSQTTAAVAWEDAAATAPQRPLVAPALRKANAAATRSTVKDGTGDVSSFHRKFGVRRHDCVEHELSCSAGITQKTNGGAAAAATFPGPLSSAKESAALERSVDHKLVKSIHGDAVFKVPANRGKRGDYQAS